MAASPALHEMFHDDAGHADHECVVTMFVHGKIDSVICEIPVVVYASWFKTTYSITSFVFTAPIKNLPRGRAPPSIAFSQV